MKIILTPKTKLGKWSIGLIVSFFAFLWIFYLLVAAGERGGATFFSNLKLTIPMLIAAGSAVASFFTGLISIIKRKERAILVFISSLIGLLVLIYVILEFSFPH